MPNHPHVDLLVVGAGIVGLAHAVEAVSRGMSVAVIDRDQRAVGASVRNFGHICITAQQGRALDYAQAGRERWLMLGDKAGFWAESTGTLVVARAEDERAVLDEFSHERGSDQVRLLSRAEVDTWLPRTGPDVVGGALLPMDLRVDPREAVPAVAAWLADEGVAFHWGVSAREVQDGLVRTSHGEHSADNVVVAVGHDIDRLVPAVADEYAVRRCLLRMLEVAAPDGARITPAVLSGLSMLRYPGLSSCPSAADVRRRITSEHPELIDVAMNLMLTQRSDGNLVLGDTHAHGLTHDPFDDEAISDLILREGSRLLGVESLSVRRRWRGVYASSDQTDFVVADPHPRTRVVSVTSGIGMTTAFGLAPEVLDSLPA